MLIKDRSDRLARLLILEWRRLTNALTLDLTTAPGKKTPKPVNPVVNAYLIAYNWASFGAWFYVLIQTTNVLLTTGNDFTKVYDVVGDHLVWIQTAALLEVLHALFGLVKSPVGTTAMQVASRLLLVWGICTLFPVPEVQFRSLLRAQLIGMCSCSCS